MVVGKNTYKLFVGNLSERTTSEDLRSLFGDHGTVVEADVMKSYGFVHMETKEMGTAAIEALNATNLHGKPMVVEASTGGRKGSGLPKRTKIFIGNIHADTKVEELQAIFEPYGEVVETDILNRYGFVHMAKEEEAKEAIRNLDGHEMHGLQLRVKESISRVRQAAGMGNSDQCYRCGSNGHWSKECPSMYRDMRERRPMRGVRDPYHDGEIGPHDRRGYGGVGLRFDPYPPRDRFREASHHQFFDEPEERYWASRRAPEEPFQRMPPPADDYLSFSRRSPIRYSGLSRSPPPFPYDRYREGPRY